MKTKGWHVGRSHAGLGLHLASTAEAQGLVPQCSQPACAQYAHSGLPLSQLNTL